MKEALTCDPSELDKLKETEQKLIGIPFISDPQDYLFPKELILDALYHCNSEGEKKRTELLIKDLERAGVIR